MSYPETDKTRIIVTLKGDKFFWDGTVNAWRGKDNHRLMCHDSYMQDYLATDYARYWKHSAKPARRSNLNLRTRILAGVG